MTFSSIVSLTIKGILSFSQPTILVPFLVLGFITHGQFLPGRRSLKGLQDGSVVWGYAILLILFTIVFNAFLKSVFKVPLNPALGKEGFAFPSGHMQTAVVVYGWVCLIYTHRLVRGALLLILGGIGYGLIHQGYHDFPDVFAAVVVGITTVYGFVHLVRLSPLQKNPARLGLALLLFSGILMILLPRIPAHLWKTLFLLTGFSLSWFFCFPVLARRFSLKTFWATSVIFGIFNVCAMKALDLLSWQGASLANSFSPWTILIPWFFASASLPLSLAFAHRLTGREKG